MIASRISILVPMVFLVSCFATTPKRQETVIGCRNDNECKGERVCEDMRCTNPISPLMVDPALSGVDKAKGKKAPQDEAKSNDQAPPLACEQGNAIECYNLGMAKAFGVNVAKDEGDARAYFQKACRGGHIFGCINLLFLLEKKNEKEGEEKEKSVFLRVQDFENIKKSCDEGDAEACFVVARFLDRSLMEGVGKDPALAREYYGKACDKGHIAGCAMAAKMWNEGLGGPANKTKAKSYFEKACAGEVAQSCATLGKMWNNGIGGPKDAGKAKEFFKKACDKGEAESCVALKRITEKASASY